ncbi:zonadhesin [Tachyglossus aculeatus]|uniref:zonadhesin n=1 Tax=Tachyglossus aculeatus TaxID=9261 RepID=UPI0018F4E681|nr:zonadhesin [Tachyglossus aculeatus]
MGPTSRPPGPTDPTRPTSPTDPSTKPPGPTDPTRPTAPTDPSTKPSSPTGPTSRPPGPTDPTRPTGPTDPSTKPPGPTGPTAKPPGITSPTTKPPGPTDPTSRPPGPTDPTRPTGPTDPSTKPPGPTDPTSKPTGPTGPTANPPGTNTPTTKPPGPTDPTRPTSPTDPSTKPTGPTDPTANPPGMTTSTPKPSGPTDPTAKTPTPTDPTPGATTSQTPTANTTTSPTTPAPGSCLPNSHYDLCVSSCPPTCEDRSPNCQVPCQPGCACDPGYVVSGSRCVNVSSCGCSHQGQYYKPGEVIFSEKCDEMCQCLGDNRTQCSPTACRPGEVCVSQSTGVQGCFPEESGTCVATGDPHFTTFDKRKFNFMGNCSYVLAATCNATGPGPAFRVVADLEHRYGNQRVSYVCALHVDLLSFRVSLLRNRVVQVNNSTVTPPSSLGSGVTVSVSGRFIVVASGSDLEVRYDGEHHADVRVARRYRDQTCGLCGDFDGDGTDDLQFPNGTLAPGPGPFGDSWATDSNCSSPVSPPARPCPEEEVESYEGPTFCGIFTSPQGPFATCHPRINPTVSRGDLSSPGGPGSRGTFAKDCVYDLCETDGDPGQLCRSLEAYAAACQAAGILLGPWRNQTRCPLVCPLNSHYETCGTRCPGSCATHEAPSCPGGCVEGCQCDPGFLLSGTTCVTQAECGCTVDGKYYKPQEEWYGPGCKEKCHCLGENRTECQEWQCGPQEVCQLQDGHYGCHASGSASCSISGDPHYLSFDGRRFSYMGTCTYTLTQPCNDSSDPKFSVAAKNEERGQRGVSYLSQVYVRVPGANVTLLKSRRTLVDGQRVTLPSEPARGVSVAQSGRFVELRTAFGLRVRWDGNHQLDVTVPSSLSGQLCGLCGDYDGDRDNDNRKPDGSAAVDEDDFGDSWQTTGDQDEECRPNQTVPPTCDPALQESLKGPEYCGRLTDPKGAFSACLPHLNASFFFENCVFDMCSYQGLHKTLCDHLAALTEACQAAGLPVEPWRGPQFCPLSCPAGSHYALCADPCPATCHRGFSPPSCPSRCTEGCECDPGFVLSGSRCVPTAQCGCLDPSGAYHEAGEQWFGPDCRERCVCEGLDNIRCEPGGCGAQESCGLQDGVLGCHPQGSAICSASGDPHYLTFDQALHHFMGTCTYTLVQPCGGPDGRENFTVTASNERRGGNARVSYVRAVHVHVFGLSVSLLKSRRVTLDGLRVELPLSAAEGRLSVGLSGSFVLLRTDFGLRVRYDGTHFVDVKVPSSYSGQLCGLCGNYNSNSSDDNLLPDGTPADNSTQLGEGWLVPDPSDPQCSPSGGEPPNCPDDDQADRWKANCAILKDPNGPFANCHGLVPVNGSLTSCVYDQCGTKGDTPTLCQSLQAYAALCAQAGVPLAWRNQTFCPLNCPSGSRYSHCTSPCPASCPGLTSPGDCPSGLPCSEGCECEPDHVLSGDACVPLSRCGCSDPDGGYHAVGDSWYTNSNCSELCSCSGPNAVTCWASSCSPTQVCRPQDGLVGCHDSGIAMCHVSGDPHYLSFDGTYHTFMGTCTYTLVSLCQPGPGLVPFNVSAKNEERGGQAQASYLRMVYVDVYGARITLQKGRRVMINEEQVRPPLVDPVPGVTITTGGIYVVLATDFGLLVKFDGNHHLEIQIPGGYFNRVCGMCGNFNNRTDDELMTPQGTQARNDTEFGNSWMAEGDSDPGCQPDTREDLNGSCGAAEKAEAAARCQAALGGPAFSACAGLVPVEPFLRGCAFDLCEFGGLGSLLCDTLQAYAAACTSQGLRPPLSWRNETFCPLLCPANSSYTPCAPTCPPTCLDLGGSCGGSRVGSLASCSEGCVCDPGFVLSEDQCVPMTQCGCVDAQGRYHGEGDWWLLGGCQQLCTCTSGSVSCQPLSCPSGSQCQLGPSGPVCRPVSTDRCSISGDPHYRTFDGFSHHFQGRQTYTLTQTVDGLPRGLEPLVVEGRNKRRLAWNRVSFLHELAVAVHGYSIQLLPGRKLVVNGEKVTPPFRPHDHLHIYLRARRLYLETDFGLAVSFDGQDSAVITLPSTYRSLVRGLCGNFDGDRKNEYMLPSGSLTRSLNTFGNSWEVKDNKAALTSSRAGARRQPRAASEEEDGESDSGFDLSGCTEEQLRVINGSQHCGAISDPHGPFTPCHSLVDPQSFQNDCLFDLCAIQSQTEAPELRCQSFTVYVAACQEQGVPLLGWRRSLNCEMSCPANTVYQGCMTPCSSSCAELAAPVECAGPCEEGCASLPGHVYSGLDSLPLRSCGCTRGARYYELGETSVSQDCSERCSCIGSGTLHCQPMSCEPGKICALANHTWGCFQKGPCLQNPCRNDGQCQEKGGDNFICECEPGYGGPLCSELRDDPSSTESEENHLLAILLGVLIPVAVIVLIVSGVLIYRRRKNLGKHRVNEEIILPSEDLIHEGTVKITKF